MAEQRYSSAGAFSEQYGQAYSPDIDLQNLRPGTPGSYNTALKSDGRETPQTPGFADNGPYSNGSAYNPSQSDLLMQHQQGAPLPHTYYFDNDKEGYNAGGAGAAAPIAGASAKRSTGPIGFIKRRPWLSAFILLVLIALGAGGAIGGIMASKNSEEESGTKTSANGAASGDHTSKGGATPTSAEAAPTPTITPFPAWSWTDPNKKMFGVSVGSWLLLERWMNEDWMIQTAGPTAYDEWSFVENLGADKALPALKEHWDSWVSEAELDTLKSVGINMIRIPVGYWAFIPAARGEPFLAMSGQKEQIDKLLGWLYTRGMYAMIDLHGLPGSQNGDQSSGHNTTDQQWWTSRNQKLSDNTISAVVDYVNASPYKSLIAGVGCVNEPMARSDDGKLGITRGFYERSYATLRAANLPMLFHHGFYDAGVPTEYWRDFATGKDPNFLIYEDHPYPGYFPINYDQDGMVNRVCQLAQNTIGYPVPIAFTEWSAVNGGGTTRFTQNYYNTQLSAYSWSAGSTFWSFKVNRSAAKVLGVEDFIQDQYSMLTLIQQGIIQKVDGNQTALQIAQALPNQLCGDIPQPTWRTPSRSGAGYAGRRRDVAAAPQPTHDFARRSTRAKRSMH